MAKARLFDLPETKGAFQLKGIVTGMDKDSAYKEIRTKSNKDMRIINFGVSYQDKKTLYPTIQGMEQDNVYFFKRGEKGEKGQTAKVPWEDRFNYKNEGFRLIGKNIGVKKKTDGDGKVVNDKKDLTDFDACREIKTNLKDGQSVFLRGNIEYSSFTDDKGNKRVSTKLVPSQVSLCGDVDFTAEDYNQQNDFNQVIVFMGIEQEMNDEKPTGRFVVSAKIVTYGTIEDVEFIIEDKALAAKFRKSLKPYWAIKVSGHMVASIQEDEVTDDDEWGEADAMTRVSAPVKREFIITGASGSSIDKELYSEDKVNDALMKIRNANKAKDDFGDSGDGDWGDMSSIDDADDEEDPWD